MVPRLEGRTLSAAGSEGSTFPCKDVLTTLPQKCRHFNNPSGNDSFSKGLIHAYQAGRILYNISIEDQTVYQTGLEATVSHIGNVIGPYWLARALAFYGGMAYQMLPRAAGKGVHDWFTDNTFFRHLPTRVNRTSCPDAHALSELCRRCYGACMRFPHPRREIWAYMRNHSRIDVKEAVKAWAKANHFKMPEFQRGDAVIQNRCDTYTLLKHPSYGPLPFRFYDGLADHSGNIYIIRDPNLGGPDPWGGTPVPPLYPCRAIHEALCSYLKSIAPKATIHSIGHENVMEDWVRMVFAPIMYGGISTFAQYAGFANDGEVYLSTRGSRELFPDLGHTFHWVNVSVLNSFEAKLFPEPELKSDDVHRIIMWLWTEKYT